MNISGNTLADVSPVQTGVNNNTTWTTTPIGNYPYHIPNVYPSPNKINIPYNPNISPNTTINPIIVDQETLKKAIAEALQEVLVGGKKKDDPTSENPPVEMVNLESICVAMIQHRDHILHLLTHFELDNASDMENLLYFLNESVALLENIIG